MPLPVFYKIKTCSPQLCSSSAGKMREIEPLGVGGGGSSGGGGGGGGERG